MKQAGFTSRELACGAKYTAAELEESGFSDESISLAGYRSSSWEFGGWESWANKVADCHRHRHYDYDHNHHRPPEYGEGKNHHGAL